MAGDANAAKSLKSERTNLAQSTGRQQACYTGCPNKKEAYNLFTAVFTNRKKGVLV